MMTELKKANLFVVGAMKARTTNFMDIVSQHQEIYTSPIKEPLFFVEHPPTELYEQSRFFDLSLYLKNDFPEPIHIANVSTREDYDQLFSLQKKERYVAEGSTFYLHCPGTPDRIRAYNAAAKIIVLLRNPLKRAFSHYKMDVGLGREKRTFTKIMEKQIKLYKNGELPWFSYLGMSLYTKRIAEFQMLFEEVLIISENDFKNGNTVVFEKVSEFLRIEPFDFQEDKKVNATRTLRFPKLFYYLKKWGLKDYFSKVFGPKTKHKLFKSFSKSAGMSMNLSSEVEKELTEIFKLESPNF